MYSVLKTLPVCIDDQYKSEGLVVVRCPFCGDSKKSKHKGHFYIRVRPAEDEPIWYKCHRCATGGVMDSYTLGLLSLYDDEVDMLAKEHQTNMTRQFGSKGLRVSDIKKIKLLPPLNNAYTRAKLNYLNNRLGIKLTQEDIFKYKIVFNLKDFLSYNNIKTLTRNPKVIDELDELYVGFLSTNNEFINFRIIDDSLINKYRKRYENYNLLDSHENTRRFITVKQKINLMKDIDIISCEGPLDLIGIHQHVYNKEDKNKIFVANMGMSAESLMNYFIKRGVIFNRLKIFGDGDVNLEYYRNLKKKLGYKYRAGEIEVFYNVYKGEKDFGVPKERIKLRSYIL